jgi:hypothetical protein
MRWHRLFATLLAVCVTAAALVWSGVALRSQGGTQSLDTLKSHGSPRGRLIPDELLFERSGLSAAPSGGTPDSGKPRGGTKYGNAFVNDPCLDPAPTATPPENFRRTVQSETEIAVLNSVDEDDDDKGDDEDDSSGRLMVAGYNDSYGFYDNRQGLSGFSYSTDGGKQWIDGGGLPPKVPSGVPSGTIGSDAYFGDPVVQVHHRTKTFYYASLYQNTAGGSTLSVNRGQFRVAPQQVPVESFANTRCEGNPAMHGIPDPPAFVRNRIIWEPPVEAVVPVIGPLPGADDDDFIDKEWLYVNQETGFLYMTYTRFQPDGSTPIEMVRSFDGGRTWTPPSVVVPNLSDTFNQATQPVVTPSGRVIVTWFARTFPAPAYVEREQRIEAAFSDDGGNTFGPPVIVDFVNPQGEPPGYNRARPTILNTPYIAVDKGRDDGVITPGERLKPGFGNVYITYFDGRTPLAQDPAPPTTSFLRQGDILLSRSTDDSTTFQPPVKVNDDPGDTSHVFPSVQVNKHAEVFVTWLDRRLDRPRNMATDTWRDISFNQGASFRTDSRVSTVSTDWITREDARPDFGDYNSSDVIRFQHFASIWADGRFPTPAPLTPTPTGGFTRPASQAATPDSLFSIIKRWGPNDHTSNNDN